MRLVYILTCILILTSCQRDSSQEKKEKPLIVVTTTLLADAIRNIVKDSADVQSLMGPGVDPHLYKASIGDLRKLVSADYVFYQGLHLEGKLGEVLAKLGRTQKVMAVADELPPESIIRADANSGFPDPHIWFDVMLWKEVISIASRKLSEQMPQAAVYFQHNTEVYGVQLDSLDTSIGKRMSTIPPKQRVLITSHDAFNYFGEAYQIEVMGLQGISTLAEFGLRDVSDLVKLILNRNIEAVFVENSVSAKSLNAVIAGASQQGSEIRIGGTLYTDALGEAGGPEGTYIGMMEYNVNTIIKGLK